MNPEKSPITGELLTSPSGTDNTALPMNIIAA